MDTSTLQNRLAFETSPYLRQHADNPVAWQPWDEEALAFARATDRPILLSIGYSACHWCHVMAHESFEDPAVAAVMNRLYVCIKVDREERPDLDKIYQSAHNLLARRGGGWPLTMFLAPGDLAPFFGGTYFPKEPRFGLPAFGDLLVQVEQYFRAHRNELAEQGPRLSAALSQETQRRPGQLGQARAQDIAARALAELKGQFDSEDGGFGDAPKFPHPVNVRRLLLAAADGDSTALAMAQATLAAMGDRGLFDHLEGGFFRYSVDGQWHIPHFEKMLYDNAQLIALYAEAFSATGTPRWRDVAIATGDWTLAHMTAPEGGFYATLDADSEGEEGQFYLWERDAFTTALTPEEAAVAIPYFGLDAPPNFEGRAYHLMISRTPAALAHDLGLTADEVTERLACSRHKLAAQRARRPRPGRDEKILASWNGLMIKGLTRTGRLLGIPSLLEAADKAWARVQTNLWDGQRLYAVTKDGRTSPHAYLDDYAFLLDAALERLMTCWRDADLTFAMALANRIMTDFEDRERGGFYFTPGDHEALLYRPKSFTDDALPSGNAVAASALLRLGHLLADPRFTTAGTRAVEAASAPLESYPSAHATLIEALEEAFAPPTIIILRGRVPQLAHWQRRAQQAFAPHRLVFAIPADAQNLPAGLAARAPLADVVAYVCEGLYCRAPITDLESFETLLDNPASTHDDQS